MTDTELELRIRNIAMAIEFHEITVAQSIEMFLALIKEYNKDQGE